MCLILVANILSLNYETSWSHDLRINQMALDRNASRSARLQNQYLEQGCKHDDLVVRIAYVKDLKKLREPD